MGRPLRTYTAEFKQQAVALADELKSAGKAAKQLGIPEGCVHNWRAKFRGHAGAVRNGSGETEAEELKRLRKEVVELKKVNHILKAAAAFFSQDHLK